MVESAGFPEPTWTRASSRTCFQQGPAVDFPVRFRVSRRMVAHPPEFGEQTDEVLKESA